MGRLLQTFQREHGWEPAPAHEPSVSGPEKPRRGPNARKPALNHTPDGRLACAHGSPWLPPGWPHVPWTAPPCCQAEMVRFLTQRR